MRKGKKQKQKKNNFRATASGRRLISLSCRRACCLLSITGRVNHITDSVSTIVVRRVGGGGGVKIMMDGWAEPYDVGAIGRVLGGVERPHPPCTHTPTNRQPLTPPPFRMASHRDDGLRLHCLPQEMNPFCLAACRSIGTKGLRAIDPAPPPPTCHCVKENLPFFYWSLVNPQFWVFDLFCFPQ